MAIDKQTTPLDSPETLTDWQRVIDLTDTLALALKNPWPVKNDNIIRGSCFYIGGAWYVANVDVAVSGTASDYIQMTVDTVNSLITPAYVSTLTDVTWNDQWNGWYDTTGHFYVFDENVAYGAGLIDFPRTVVYSRPKNAESAKALSTAMGDNWAHFLECTVDPLDDEAVNVGLPNTLFPTYNVSDIVTHPGASYSSSDWVTLATITALNANVPATLKAFRFGWTNDNKDSSNYVRIMEGATVIAIWEDTTSSTNDVTTDLIMPKTLTVQYKPNSGGIRGPFGMSVSSSCMSDADPSPNLFQFLFKMNGGVVSIA